MDVQTGNNNINTTDTEYMVWRAGDKSRPRQYNVVQASSAFQARKREGERLGVPITELSAMRYQRP